MTVKQQNYQTVEQQNDQTTVKRQYYYITVKLNYSKNIFFNNENHNYFILPVIVLRK